ncbi:MAG TPA: sulfite exporter TauE/SafE family protein [Limnobacter sp.]|uniref:sulfite exporter TauE/SafE family protein n=1 Tax=Limnobacter sp. TaxID=2003368 RepID=UPI002ED808BD
MIDPIFIAALLVLGVFSGVLAGMLGIGGGMILVPFLSFLLHKQGVPADHVVHASIATSLAIIVFTSISSMRAHHQAGAIRWDIVKFLTPGILIGGFIGSKIVSYLPTKELALSFGVFVIFSAYQMFADKKPKPSRTLPGAAGMVGVGSVIGGVSSIVGAGGGFLSVPFMVWSNVPVRNAVATSAALGFPIAVFASMGYIINGLHLEGMPAGSLGYIYMPAVACVAVMSMLTAPRGAKLAHSLPVGRIKRVFAVLLTFVALSMIYKAITGF